MMHFISISSIAFLLYVAFITFFRDFAKHQWEKGNARFTPLPQDLRSFVIAYKVVLIMVLLIVIYVYVSFLLGIPIPPF